MPLEYVILSQKGKKLLLLNGYLYDTHQKHDEKIVRRCAAKQEIFFVKANVVLQQTMNQVL